MKINEYTTPQKPKRRNFVAKHMRDAGARPKVEPSKKNQYKRRDKHKTDYRDAE
jgi:hypothetical protein